MGTATQQQVRQFTIQHQLIQQRKSQQQQAKNSQLAQAVTLGTVKGNVVSVPAQQLGTAVGTVQLVQPVGSNSGSGSTGTGVGGSKPTTVTMQQLQQVIRQVTAGNAQVLVSSPSSGISSGSSGTALLTKTPQGQTVQARVIPVSQQGLKQTIQVVTTGQPGSAGGTTRVATASGSGCSRFSLCFSRRNVESSRWNRCPTEGAAVAGFSSTAKRPTRFSGGSGRT